MLLVLTFKASKLALPRGFLANLPRPPPSPHLPTLLLTPGMLGSDFCGIFWAEVLLGNASVPKSGTRNAAAQHYTQRVYGTPFSEYTIHLMRWALGTSATGRELGSIITFLLRRIISLDIGLEPVDNEMSKTFGGNIVPFRPNTR